MKYLKKFEINENNPEIGDYIICDGEYTDEEFSNHINNNIGILLVIGPLSCEIFYPDYIDKNYTNGKPYYINYNDILFWSKDKKELEIILKSRKFNL